MKFPKNLRTMTLGTNLLALIKKKRVINLMGNFGVSLSKGKNVMYLLCNANV